MGAIRAPYSLWGLHNPILAIEKLRAKTKAALD
jgi:hypothetical protein